jgi:hypothetical protein
MWALHNPDEYSNLCRLHPKYTEMEAAHNGRAGTHGSDKKAGTLAPWGILAEGEMLALAWIPPIVIIILDCIVGPAALPSEGRDCTRHRKGTASWFWKTVHASWVDKAKSFTELQVLMRLGD